MYCKSRSVSFRCGIRCFSSIMGRPSVFLWDDVSKGYLIQCREEVRSARLTYKQQHVELQRLFQLLYPVCKLSGSTLSVYATDFATARLPVVHKSTELWHADMVSDLVKCVEAARLSNSQSQSLGLQAGKRGRPG